VDSTSKSFVSVASDEDVALGNKVNFTHLSNIIVANTFGLKKADELFSNFESKSSQFTKEKIRQEQTKLIQKFKDAGIIGSNSLLSESDADFMNGTFSAGSSSGMDGLLDVLDIDFESSTNIKVAFKSNVPGMNGANIFEDSIDENVEDPEVTLDSATFLSKVSEIKTQLNEQASLYDGVKSTFENISSSYNSFTSRCGGPASEDCKTEGYNLFTKILHTSYKDNGFNREQDIWSWFCYSDADLENEAKSRSDCAYIANESITFSNVAIVDFLPSEEKALISFTIGWTEEGVESKEFEVDVFKKDTDNNWKFYGNQQSDRFYFDVENRAKAVYNLAGDEKEAMSYSTAINLYISEMATPLTEGETVTITGENILTSGLVFEAVAGPGSSSQIYLIQQGKAYVNSCDKSTYSTQAACESSDLDCDGDSSFVEGYCSLNYEGNRYELSEEQVLAMDEIEAFSLSFKKADGSAHATASAPQPVFVVRPKRLTANNAEEYLATPVYPESWSELCASIGNNSGVPEIEVDAGDKSTLNYYYMDIHSYCASGNCSGSDPSAVQGDLSGKNDTVTAGVDLQVASGFELGGAYIYFATYDAFGTQYSLDIQCHNY